MKVLVTGASGFIGSHVALDLLRRGHGVAVLLRGASDPWRLAGALDRLHVVRGDLAQPASYSTALREWGPEAIAHLAWTGVANHDRNDWRQVDNVTQAARLLEAAVAGGAKHFIGCGSQAEYGPRADRTPESAALQPTTAYGAAKVATFHLLQPLAGLHGVRFAWARFFSTYGPRDEAHWMIPQLIGRLLRGERPALTEGRQQWDYCHVRDAAHAVTRLVEAREASGPFNVGSGSTLSVRRIAELIRDAAAPGAPLGFGEVPYRPDQVMHLEADISKLVQATGWRPEIPLDAGLAETVAWYRDAEAHHAGTH
jgi:nucleoside-diphosphate-sugar epimerase